MYALSFTSSVINFLQSSSILGQPPYNYYMELQDYNNNQSSSSKVSKVYSVMGAKKS